MPGITDHEIAPGSLAELLALEPDELAAVDIGRANLLCAECLPGAEDLDVEQHVRRLDAWAERVRRMTERHLSSFYANPGHFENSEAKWRLLALAKVLREECGVRYHSERIDSEPDWTDSQDLMIHGITGPRRTGTCASLPVFVVAICRRLNYPVYLSHAPGHCMSRWDGENDINEAWQERFNIEFSGDVDFFDDEHYYDFPVRWSHQARELHRRDDLTCEYLYSFTPAQEFAHSFCQRGVCLEAVGRYTDAVNVYYRCRNYDERWGGYFDFAMRALRSRAEQVMRSLGLDPSCFRAWITHDRLAGLGRSAQPMPLHSPAASHSTNGIQQLTTARPVTPSSTTAEMLNPSLSNLEELAYNILHRTCDGTPANPSVDLLLPHPPERKVDPYASLRDENGRVRFD